jgi:hypothetical protein
MSEKNENIATKILSETSNYLVWSAEEPDGEMTYHLELNNVTVHFFEEEWQDVLAAVKGWKAQEADDDEAFYLELDNVTVQFNEQEWEEFLTLVLGVE